MIRRSWSVCERARSAYISLGLVGFATLLALVAAAPGFHGNPDRESLAELSLPIAVLLLVVRIAVNRYALRRQRMLFSPADRERGGWPFGTALIVLGLATIVTAFVTETLVGTLQAFADRADLSEFVVAVLIVAIIGTDTPGSSRLVGLRAPCPQLSARRARGDGGSLPPCRRSSFGPAKPSALAEPSSWPPTPFSRLPSTSPAIADARAPHKGCCVSLRIAFLVAGLLFLFGTGLAGAGGQAYRVGTLLKIVSQDLSESRAGAPQPPVDEGGGGAQEHNGVVWWITIRSAPFVYFSKVVVDAGAPAWLGSFRSCERVRFRVSGQKLFLARLNGTEVEARLVSVGRAAPGRLCSRRR